MRSRSCSRTAKAIEEMPFSTPFRRIALFPIFRQITFAIVLLALFGSGPPAAAQDTTAQSAAPPRQSTAEIAFVDPAPQLLAPKSGETFEFDVALKNAGKLPGTPAFKLLGKDCGDVGPVTAPPTYRDPTARRRRYPKAAHFGCQVAGTLSSGTADTGRAVSQSIAEATQARAAPCDVVPSWFGCGDA